MESDWVYRRVMFGHYQFQRSGALEDDPMSGIFLRAHEVDEVIHRLQQLKEEHYDS